MLKIGLTGGIGSGKSIVAKAFGIIGVPVYVSDVEAKRLMNSDPEVRRLLISRFGSEIYDAHSNLKRKLLAEIVFNDRNSLLDINAIVHPAVRSDFNKWCEQFAHLPYVIQESAILFDSDLYRSFDQVITVSADQELRIQRVLARDASTREQIIGRMRNQLPESVRIEKANFVIYNNTDLLFPQINLIDKKIKALAKR
ncbi:dephospho-CoA kinase [Labilibaculum sp.]|uniref:dephospho-CoA kinase n=1 Tax=Labilibaculum sp. TaxID=2060723 RepID=UPI003561A951